MFDRFILSPAKTDEAPVIWQLLQSAIQKRKAEGSQQWQDGYPNLQVVQEDIKNEYAYVAKNEEGNICGYMAIITEKEPAYEKEGVRWLTQRPYVVIHRLATDQRNPIKGLATWMMKSLENISLKKGCLSIKADTDFDNVGMLRVFDKMGYTYCGIVILRGAERKAFEKRLD